MTRLPHQVLVCSRRRPTSTTVEYLLLRRTPARAALNEHDLFGGTRPDGTGERVEFDGEELDVHRRREMPHRARSRRDARSQPDSARHSEARSGRAGADRPASRPCTGWASNQCGVRQRPRALRSPAERPSPPRVPRTQALLELCLGLRVGLHMPRLGLQPVGARPAARKLRTQLIWP